MAWHPIGLPCTDLRLHVPKTSCGPLDGVLHPGAAGSRYSVKSADSAHFWTYAELPGSLLLLCAPCCWKALTFTAALPRLAPPQASPSLHDQHHPPFTQATKLRCEWGGGSFDFLRALFSASGPHTALEPRLASTLVYSRSSFQRIWSQVGC